MGITLASAAGRRKIGSGKYHYRMIRKNVRLVYRRPRGGGAGTWFLRVHTAKDAKRGYKGGYRQVRLGTADDAHPANDKNILNFEQATRKASDLAIALYEVIEKKPTHFTVADACAAYLKHLESEGRTARAIRDAKYKIDADILPALGERECNELSAKELKDWRNALVKENTRSRRATANRTLTTLKAALNYGFQEEWIEGDAAWRRVKPFKGTDAPREHWLTVEEAKALIAACTGDFRQLVEAALHTGCRYGELIALRVEDFSHTNGTLHIATSKAGKSRDVVLTDAGSAFFQRLCRKREAKELILHNGSRAWQRSEQTRPMKAAVAKAKLPAISFHGLRHTWASLAVQAGVPLLVVAKNLGHSGTRMVEKHYGHLAKSYVADAIRAGAPQF